MSARRSRHQLAIDLRLACSGDCEITPLFLTRCQLDVVRNALGFYARAGEPADYEKTMEMLAVLAEMRGQQPAHRVG
jgi:hypothetical protein